MASPQIFTHPIEVRFRDLDSLGHINNAVYLSYVEQCRTKWLAKAALCSHDSLHAIPLILARAEIDFIKPGRIADDIQVRAWISHIGHKSFHMQYEIASEQSGLLARSQAVLVWFDYRENISVAIPQHARLALEGYFLADSQKA